MQSFKINQLLEPIEGEIWVPINGSGIESVDGYFISTEGRVAKLHVGLDPYNFETIPYMLSAGFYKGASGLLVEIIKGIGIRKRAMITTLFFDNFLGPDYFLSKKSTKVVPIISENVKVPIYLKDPTNVHIKDFMKYSQALFFQKDIMNENYYKQDDTFKIFPYALNNPHAGLCNAHNILLQGGLKKCPPQGSEYVDGSGITWRSIITSNVSDAEGYWISTLGNIVQFPGFFGSPVTNDKGVLIGVNCLQVYPESNKLIGNRGPVVALKSSSGFLTHHYIRDLVYKTFIDPTNNRLVNCVIKEPFDCQLNHLTIL